MFIVNTQAQVMHEYWKCEYEYNDADMTASVKLWMGYIGGNPIDGMGWKDVEEIGGNIIVIPDSVIYNGQTYTVTTLKKGMDIGWMIIYPNYEPEYCRVPIKVYVPKTIKCIESKVFERKKEAINVVNKNPTGDFWFYFEDERTEQYANEYSMKMMGHPAFNNFEGVGRYQFQGTSQWKDYK